MEISILTGLDEIGSDFLLCKSPMDLLFQMGAFRGYTEAETKEYECYPESFIGLNTHGCR